MTRCVRAWTIATAALLAASAWPAEANDHCHDALPIAGEGIFAFDNSGALTDRGDELACCAVERDVWFLWTAACDELVNVSTCGLTDLDTAIGVYQANGCPPLYADEVGCNDDSCGLQSQVQFTAVAGQEYLIRIGSYPGTVAGIGEFSIACEPLAVNDSCSGAILIPCNQLQFVNVIHATRVDPNFSCLRGGRGVLQTVWYAFVAEATSATISTCAADTGDTVMEVFRGSCASFQSIGCSDDACEVQSEVTLENLTVGNTYYIHLGVYRFNEGEHTLLVSCPAEPPPADPPCALEDEFCRAPEPSASFASDRLVYSAADDFMVATDGEISEICWWGSYSDGEEDFPPPPMEAFEIRYFADDGGVPGALLAEYQQDLGELNVQGPVWTRRWLGGVVRQYEYTAAHPALPVLAGQCYWVEITNTPDGCGWYWQAGAPGNQRALQDGEPMDGYDSADAFTGDQAFCVDVELADTSDCLPPRPPPICDDSGANCQAGNLYYSGVVSSRFGPLAADDFYVTQDGMVSQLCWWGGYAGLSRSDDFQIMYYVDGGGVPGELLAGPFREQGGSLSIDGREASGERLAGVYPEYGYTASHAPVPVIAGTRYWIQITNTLDGQWLWERAALDAGNGRAAVDVGRDGYGVRDLIFDDFAFCLNLELDPQTPATAPPVNDECSGAIELVAGSSHTYDTTFATNDAGDPAISCAYRGGTGTVWFKFTATAPTARISTTGTPFGDPVFGVYAGSCGNFTEIGCADDNSSFRGETCLENLTVGQTYFIQAASYTDATRGLNTIALISPCPSVPANDLCANAVGPLAVPSLTVGATIAAGADFTAPDCSRILITTPGVWYFVEGTGRRVTASLCSAATDFDTRLNVYTGTCDELACVGNNDDDCDFRSRLMWNSEPGTTYYVLVHGAGGASGRFALELSETTPADANCDGAVDGADIDAFFLALSDPAGHQAMYPGCSLSNSDVNGDGGLDGADIDAFFECLMGNCP